MRVFAFAKVLAKQWASRKLTWGIAAGVVIAVAGTIAALRLSAPEVKTAEAVDPQVIAAHTRNKTDTKPKQPAVTPEPVRSVPTPAPAPAGPILEYYVDKGQAFYQNIRAMQDSGAYPSLGTKLAALQNEPIATWLGEWIGGSKEVESRVHTVTTYAATSNRMPVFVAYNIPNRDLGQYSSGGASSARSYEDWIAGVSRGIADKPAVVILEPDALAGVPDMSPKAGDERLAMLHTALVTFATNNPKAYVYLDGGNSQWLDPADLAKLLKSVYGGTNQQPRISLNVSNYRPASELSAYLSKVSKAYGSQVKALFDVGLNGAPTPPAADDWCNPRAARHGAADDNKFDPAAAIEQLMVRPLGESSGECELGDPDAGVFDPDLAATILGLPSGRYK